MCYLSTLPTVHDSLTAVFAERNSYVVRADHVILAKHITIHTV